MCASWLDIHHLSNPPSFDPPSSHFHWKENCLGLELTLFQIRATGEEKNHEAKST